MENINTKPTEYKMICNPTFSDELERAIEKGRVEADFASLNARQYYTSSVAEQLVHNPEDYHEIDLGLSEQLVEDILKLEEDYDIVMIVY